MNEDRRKILGMLADSKITADEAERLIAALDRPSPSAGPSPGAAAPQYLRVQVEKPERGDREGKSVNIRVPLSLMRAGMRLPGFLPPKARDALTAAMARKGVDVDLDKLKGENIEAFIAALGDASIDIDADDGRARVKVSCE
ncbi:MAG TPA: hypothetical protein VGH15_08320 [Caulobacteraceae bacterium]